MGGREKWCEWLAESVTIITFSSWKPYRFPDIWIAVAPHLPRYHHSSMDPIAQWKRFDWPLLRTSFVACLVEQRHLDFVVLFRWLHPGPSVPLERIQWH